MNSTENSTLLRFFEYLKEHKMTVKQVSDATGIPQTTIASWRSGIRKPKYEAVKTIADYLNVSAEYLLGTESKEISTDNIRNLIVTDVLVNTLSKEISLEADKLDDNQKENLLEYIKFLQSRSEKIAADEEAASSIRRNYSI